MNDFRKLRIVRAVLGGLASMLLCVLWVRSYWVVDGVDIPCTTQHTIQIGSLSGELAIVWLTAHPRNLSVWHYSMAQWQRLAELMVPRPLVGDVSREDSMVVVWVPIWFLVVLFATSPLLRVPALQPPHTPNRHDACCRLARADRVERRILTDPVRSLQRSVFEASQSE